MWCWLSTVALAALPEVAVSWKGTVGALEIVAPEGQVINPDSPASLSVRWAGRSLRVEGTAAQVALVRLSELPGAEVQGELSVQLCRKADGVCEQVDVALAGEVPPGRRGRVGLGVSEAAPAAEGHDLLAAYRTDADAVVSAAYARAAAEGKRVMLDFGAVWCPPCNQLSAEILDHLPSAAELEGLVVAKIDADDVRSYGLKSRYAVGGYPTIVITDVEGHEISRTVGYPGRDEFLAWAARASAQPRPDDDPGSVDPASVDPARAAEIAWTLVRRADKGAKAFVERAAAGEPTRALRLARLSVEPNAEDALWLLDHPEPGPSGAGALGEWAGPAISALREDEAAQARLRDLLRAELSGAEGFDAVELLSLLADASPEPARPALYGAAAATLRTALSGDDARDRGFLTWLAELQAEGGDLDGAIASLADASARWPGEPTFHLTAARLLLDGERSADAHTHSAAALEKSWGDNRLRAAELHCEVLVALGRQDEATELARRVLAEIPPPAEGQKVRATRYRDKLEARLKP